MPGRKHHTGTFMEHAWEYRRVQAADSNAPAAIDALVAIIDMKNNRDLTVHNRLDLQVVVPDSVSSYNIEVYGDLIGEFLVGVDNGGANRWAQVDGFTNRTRSTFLTILDCPPGLIKVLITNVVGDATVNPIMIFASRSQ